MIAKLKSSKMKIIFAFMIAVVLLTASVLAVITITSVFQSGGSSMTMAKTGTAVFDVSIFSTHSPLAYNINMYNPSGALVKSWASNVQNDDGWVELIGLQVNRSDITIGGVYTIYITSNDNYGYSSGETLTLTVLNGVPTIGAVTAPSSINAGETLNVSFSATDPDGDALVYRIYRNDVLVSNTNNNSWQTSASDAGTYTYRFEASDGENVMTSTMTIVVNPSGASSTVTAEEFPEKLSLGKDIEISRLYNLIKIRSNKGEVLDNFELRINYLDINAVETYNFDLARNEVVYKLLSTKLQKNMTYLARISIRAEGLDDSGYLLIKN